MKTRIYVGVGVSVGIAAVVLAVTVGAAIAHSSGATPLPASSCSPIQNPNGQYLIASDLPLQGPGRAQTFQMTKAIAYVLKRHSWRAGKYTLAYQSCDDSTAKAGKWDSGKTSANANAYAEDSSLAGVVGPLNSGAAEILVPVLNRAPNGPVAVVSPSNTYVGLTHGGPGTVVGEPGKYYPTAKRSYARVVAADDYQSAADALLAQSFGVKKVFILNDNDKEAYGLGVASNFRNAATKLGIKTVGFTTWNGRASSYRALAARIKASGAQAVFLGGLISENGGKVIKDIRAGVPAGVKIMLPDGFTPASATLKEAGSAVQGATLSVAGLPNSALKGAGKTFVDGFTKAVGVPDPYAVYAAQAAEVMIQAITQSNGTRADITKQLFKVDLKNSILGDMSFNANGDVNSNPVTIYKFTGNAAPTYKVIVPPKSLVKPA